MSVGGIVGGIIGFIYGGPAGAQWGYAIGSGAEAYLDPQTVSVSGPRMADLSVTFSTEGAAIPEVWGAMRVSLNLHWATDIIEKKKTESQGGKGGPTQETTTYKYFGNYAGILAEGEIAGVRKYWSSGKLVFDGGADATAGTLVASGMGARSFKVYPGSETQMPDPTIESYEGAGVVPAFRGTAYAVWNFRNLGPWGNAIPNDTAEVVRHGSATVAFTMWDEIDGIFGSNGSVFWPGNVTFIAPESDEILMFDFQDAGSTQDVLLYSLSPSGRMLVGKVAESFDAAQPLIGNADEVCVLVSPSVGDRDLALITYGPFGGTSYSFVGASGYTPGTDGSGLRGRWAKNADRIVITRDHPGTACDLFIDRIWVATQDPGERIAGCLVTGSYVYWFCNPNSSGTGITVYKRDRDDLSAISEFEWSVAYTTTTFPFFSVVSDEEIWIQHGDGKFYLFDGDATITLEHTANPGFQTSVDAFCRAGAMFNCIGRNNSQYLVPATVNPAAVTLNPPTVGDIVSDLCQQVGMAAEEIDVTDLTDAVSGFVRTRQMPADSAIKVLQQAYFFDKKEDRRVVTFVPRGASSSRTIDIEDLVVTSADAEILPYAMTPEEELPFAVTVKFTDPDNDYQPGSETAYRQTTGSQLIVALDLTAIAMSPDQAMTIAQKTLDEAWIGRFRYGPFCTTMAHADAEETDVITVSETGRDHVMRLTRKSYRQGYIEFYGVASDPLVYDRTAVGNSQPANPQSVSLIEPTLLELLDIPILQDADSNSGIYIATSPRGPTWSGAVIRKSDEDQDIWQEIGGVEQEGVIGTTSGALGSWSGGNLFDEGSSVTVVLSGEGSLSTITRATMLASRSVNTALVGNEIIRFREATLIATDTYRLTGLLRGRLGTEWAMNSHDAYERFVLLAEAGMIRHDGGIGDINSNRYYQALSLGRSAINTQTKAIANTAAGLKPYSPVHVRGARDGSNNATLSWMRRTRMQSYFFDATGELSTPLGETYERYEVEIYDGSGYENVVRTLTVNDVVEADYTAAQQTEDGLTPGNTLYCKVYQLSSVIGRGFAAQAAV